MKNLTIAAAAALLLGATGVAMANDNLPSPGAQYGEGYVQRIAPGVTAPMRRPGVLPLYEGRTAYEGRGFVAPVPVPFLSRPAGVADLAPGGMPSYSPSYGTNLY